MGRAPALASSVPERRSILCFGDSNTFGVDPVNGGRFPFDVRWPGVLEAELGAPWRVIEEGLSGRTTVFDDPFIDGRNGRSYLVPCLASHAPIDLLTIMLGTNDLKAVFRADPAMIGYGMVSLIRLARRSEAGPNGGPPAILVMAPALLGPFSDVADLWGFANAAEASRQVTKALRVAAEHEGVKFLDAGQVAHVDANEGVHLTADSHRALGLAVAAWVSEFFPRT